MRSAARRRASQPTTTPPTPTPIRDSRSGLRRICWLGARNSRATGLTRLRRRRPQAAAAGTARPTAPPPTSPRGSAGRIESRAAPPRPPPAQPPQPWIHRKTRKCVVGGGLLTYLVAEVEADDCAERPVERVFDPHAARAAWFAQQMQPALACVVCGTICDQQPVRPRRGSRAGGRDGGQSRGAEPGAETAARDLRRTNVPRSIIALAPTLGRFGAVGSAAPDGQHRSDEGHRERHVVMRDEHHERDHLHLQVQARLRTDDRRSAGARRRSRGGLTYQRLQTAEDMDAGIPAGQHLRHQRIDLHLKLRELRRRHV